MEYSGAVIKTIYHEGYFKDLVVTENVDRMLSDWLVNNANQEATMDIAICHYVDGKYEFYRHYTKTATVVYDEESGIYTYLVTPAGGQGGIMISTDNKEGARGYEWLRFSYDELPDDYLLITNFDKGTCDFYGVEYLEIDSEE